MLAWGISSFGRAPVSHTGSAGFESPMLHQVSFLDKKTADQAVLFVFSNFRICCIVWFPHDHILKSGNIML